MGLGGCVTLRFLLSCPALGARFRFSSSCNVEQSHSLFVALISVTLTDCCVCVWLNGALHQTELGSKPVNMSSIYRHTWEIKRSRAAGPATQSPGRHSDTVENNMFLDASVQQSRSASSSADLLKSINTSRSWMLRFFRQ